MTDPATTRRSFRPTPGWLIYGSLIVEGLLWLSERLQWPTWHKGYAVLLAVASVGVAVLLMLGWFIVALVFRWRFQFGIRTLLVLTLAVAVPLSWLGAEMQKAKRQIAVIRFVQGHGGSVTYERDRGPLIVADGRIARSLAPQRPPLRTLGRRVFGDDFFDDVVEVCLNNADIGDGDLGRLATLTRLKELYIMGTPLSDAGLEHLAGLVELEELCVGGQHVTDDGVNKLQQALPKCKIY